MAKLNLNEKQLISTISKRLLNMKSISQLSGKGVRLVVDDDKLIINLYIRVFYGVNIPQLSYDIQTKCKKMLDEEYKLPVSAININVEGIDINKENHD